MEPSHRRVLMDRRLLLAAKQGDESRFARLVGLEKDGTAITIDESSGIAIARCIGIDEPDFFLGVTYTGDSLLHLVAGSSNFLDLADRIWHRERSLLTTRNKVLDTPLHCAARNGNDQMVSRFIGFAREMGEEVLKEVMRATNKHGETALHEAARHNHAHVTDVLMTGDPGLAGVMDDKRVSPLYLATTSEFLDVVHAIIRGLTTQEVILKAVFAGPEGQTVLHAAVLRGEGLTKELLNCQPWLARMPDNSGSTPLHFAASFGYIDTVGTLLDHDHSIAYLHDSCGLFPVHLAASRGHVEIIKMLLEYCPNSDELIDDQGRNFLHVAAQEGQRHVVQYICQTNAMHKIMKNARDNEGNTPIHLALNARHESTIKDLMSDKEVFLHTSNKNGLTPRDLSEIAYFKDNAIKPTLQLVDNWIKRSMKLVGASYGPWLWDHFIRDHPIKEDPKKENEKLTSAIQNIGFVSVLIATVTFAAAFTLPGGYRADDHYKAGTPTLAKKYAFKAFLVADTLAFMLAFQSTLTILFATC